MNLLVDLQEVCDGTRSVLSAGDYLDGVSGPPALLSLASCHSGFPWDDDPHEPLGLALTALAAGVDQVVSSTFELDAKPGPATECLAHLYTALATDDAPARVLGNFQRDSRRRRSTAVDPLYQWAVLAVIGTHPTTA